MSRLAAASRYRDPTLFCFKGAMATSAGSRERRSERQTKYDRDCCRQHPAEAAHGQRSGRALIIERLPDRHHHGREHPDGGHGKDRDRHARQHAEHAQPSWRRRKTNRPQQLANVGARLRLRHDPYADLEDDERPGGPGKQGDRAHERDVRQRMTAKADGSNSGCRAGQEDDGARLNRGMLVSLDFLVDRGVERRRADQPLQKRIRPCDGLHGVPYGAIVMRSSIWVTPGAAHAARSASCRSAHERTLPVSTTFPSSAATWTRRASISALRLNAASIL